MPFTLNMTFPIVWSIYFQFTSLTVKLFPFFDWLSFSCWRELFFILQNWAKAFVLNGIYNLESLFGYLLIKSFHNRQLLLTFLLTEFQNKEMLLIFRLIYKHPISNPSNLSFAIVFSIEYELTFPPSQSLFGIFQISKPYVYPIMDKGIIKLFFG